MLVVRYTVDAAGLQCGVGNKKYQVRDLCVSDRGFCVGGGEGGVPMVISTFLRLSLSCVILRRTWEKHPLQPLAPLQPIHKNVEALLSHHRVCGTHHRRVHLICACALHIVASPTSDHNVL